MPGPHVIEVEVKSRIGDLRALERNLRKAGARKIDDIVEKDIYYNHPSRDFARTDEALRVRVRGNKADLTYKGPKLDFSSKSREELVLPIADPKSAKGILEKLGFRRVAAVRKRRRVYALGRFEVCVDRVEKVGDYFEVEAIAPRKGYAKVRKEALALLAMLGGQEQERRSYLEMLLSRQDR